MRIVIFIFAIWVLALTKGVSSECCRTMVNLQYRIPGEECSAVGGHRFGDSCMVTICGNGEALVGTWCGRGTCNWLGCVCRNGCLSGNWVSEFLAKNMQYNIEIQDAKWTYYY